VLNRAGRLGLGFTQDMKVEDIVHELETRLREFSN